MRHRFSKVLLGVALFVLLGGTATVAARSHHSSAGSYNVGIVYSRTRLLSAYGAEEIEGFKEGLKYATGGTGKVNGKTINVTYVDDKTDAATAVNAAKDLIGQGYKIIGGTDSSGVALQVAPLAAQNHVLYISGPAASDAITGVNKYTFRAGRREEGRRLRPGFRVRSRQLRRRQGGAREQGPHGHRGLRAADGDGLHAV